MVLANPSGRENNSPWKNFVQKCSEETSHRKKDDESELQPPLLFFHASTSRQW